MSRLETIETFDHFNMAQWRALGTKLGGIEAVKKILQEQATVILTDRVLSSPKERMLTEVSLSGLREKLQSDREDLLVSRHVKNDILPFLSNDAIHVPETSWLSADVMMAKSDTELHETWSDISFFTDVDALFAQLWSLMIFGQRYGSKGVLSISSCGNAFYLELPDGNRLVLQVVFDKKYLEWRIYRQEFNERERGVGFRIFTPRK